MGDDIYQKLREWLHNCSPSGFIETQSGEEMELLKYLFTPEEGQVAICLSMDLKSLKTIAGLAGTSPAIAEKLLDNLYLKGAIRRHVDAKGKSYAGLAFVPGIAENLVWTGGDEQLEALVAKILKINGLRAFQNKIGTSRTVPVAFSIPAESVSVPYQDAIAMVKRAAQPILVFPCHCRMSQKKCNAPLEVCLAFGDHAQFYLDVGSKAARQITVEEALNILQISAEAGLVHQFINYTDDDLSWLCNCCGCCCINLGVSNKFFPDGKVSNVDSSIYLAAVNAETCTGCEACVERCPVHALEIKEEIATINSVRCIGCGQCVTVCPVEAIKLDKRADDQIPRTPKNWRELIDRHHAAHLRK